MPLSESLIRARKAAGLGVREAARRVGVKPSSLAQWETGRSKPRSMRLGTIAQVYGTTVEALLSDDGGMAQRATESEFLALFRRIPDAERTALLSIMAKLAR